MFKINKKLQNARGSHAGATWHARPRGRAMRTRAAPTWRVLYIYSLFIIIISIKGLQPSIYGKGY